MALEFKTIKETPTLSQEIQELIEEAILEKKVLPGEKLPTEHEMCKMFGVSRTALREALQNLRAKGLITVKKGSGIYVEDYSPQNIIKPMRLYLELNFDRNYILYLMEVRKMIEPEIARLAARNRSEEDIHLLAANLEKFKLASKNDFATESELDREFHLLIANATKNPIISVIVGPIFQLMPKIRTLVYAHIDIAKSAAQEYHQKIFDSIRDGDEQKAFQFMREHLRIAEEHSKEIAQKLK